jgi:DNA-binding response OmpR family regulator
MGGTVPGKTKVLIIEDDPHIAELLALYLEKEGYETKEARDGRKGVEVFAVYAPHLVLLDLMLPEMDGFQVCREIRKISAVPVIMLTARGDTFDKVLGLELGADDYIVKPFEPKELTARVKAVLRRTEAREGDVTQQLVFPGLAINHSAYTVTYHGTQMTLPPKEFELLYFLASHPGQTFTRETLLDRLWGYEFMGETRTVDVHIKRLREKFTGEDAWSIKTVWGIGYKFEA